jgi:hypothetical protein
VRTFLFSFPSIHHRLCIDLVSHALHPLFGYLSSPFRTRYTRLSNTFEPRFACLTHAFRTPLSLISHTLHPLFGYLSASFHIPYTRFSNSSPWFDIYISTFETKRGRGGKQLNCGVAAVYTGCQPNQAWLHCLEQWLKAVICNMGHRDEFHVRDLDRGLGTAIFFSSLCWQRGMVVDVVKISRHSNTSAPWQYTSKLMRNTRKPLSLSK